MGESAVKRLAIELDRTNGTYMPGELVSGRVLAEFAQPTQIRGLEVVIVGESLVQWSTERDNPVDKSETYYEYRVNYRQPDPYTLMTGHEEYFTKKFYLLGSESGPPLMVPAGRHAYPFQFQLPCNLPSSFEHEHGHVRYTIKAIFDKKMDAQVMTAFTVISTYDLNRIPDASIPIKDEVIRKFSCSWIFTKRKIRARFFVSSSGFVPGQVIPVIVDCENESNVNVEKIKVSLRRELKFHSKVPDWATKVEKSAVAETKCVAPFTNNSGDRVTIQLKVPPVPPTGLEHCELIDVDYVLRIVMCFSGMHLSIKRRCPILIGTIPLANSENTYQSNTTTAPHQIQGSFPLVIPNSSHGDSSNLPPPSRDTLPYVVRTIGNNNESVHVHGAGNLFAPRYPVYDHASASAASSHPMVDKYHSNRSPK